MGAAQLIAHAAGRDFRRERFNKHRIIVRPRPCDSAALTLSIRESFRGPGLSVSGLSEPSSQMSSFFASSNTGMLS